MIAGILKQRSFAKQGRVKLEIFYIKITFLNLLRQYSVMRYISMLTSELGAESLYSGELIAESHETTTSCSTYETICGL